MPNLEPNRSNAGAETLLTDYWLTLHWLVSIEVGQDYLIDRLESLGLHEPFLFRHGAGSEC